MTDEELIKAVAEIMGWSRNPEYGIVFGPIENDPQHRLEAKKPLTDLNHAFQVVEKMREEGFTLKMGYGDTVQGILAWVGFEAEPYKSYSHDKQVGKAICLAARRAKEGSDG